MSIHLILGEVVSGVEVPDPFAPMVCGGHKVRLTLGSPVGPFLRLHLQRPELVIGENRIPSLPKGLPGFVVAFNSPLQGYNPLFFELNSGSRDSFQVLVRW